MRAIFRRAPFEAMFSATYTSAPARPDRWRLGSSGCGYGSKHFDGEFFGNAKRDNCFSRRVNFIGGRICGRDAVTIELHADQT